MPRPAPTPTPTLHDEVVATLKRLQAKHPGLKRQLKTAHGYAIFPSVGKASVVVGGAYGRGEVYEKGEVIGYATLSQLTLGVQLGGDTFSEIVIFDNKQALDRFKRGKTALAANASAVLVKSGAAGTKSPEKGMTAYAFSRGGMLLELAIGGQKFNFKPIDQEQGDEEGGEQGQEGQEQETGAGETGGGVAGRAMGGFRAAASMVREHPVAATVIGVGVAAGVGLLVARKLRSGAAAGQEEGQDDGQEDDDDQADEEMSADEGQDEEGASQDDDDRDDAEEDDADARARAREDDEEGRDEDEERQASGNQRQRTSGVLNRILGRGRTRA